MMQHTVWLLLLVIVAAEVVVAGGNLMMWQLPLRHDHIRMLSFGIVHAFVCVCCTKQGCSC